MKKYLLLLNLFFALCAKAQNVNIPDANFKNYLVSNPAINTNGDGEIQVSEAAAYNTYLNVASKNISDLTGIEAFTAIPQLYCGGNKLTGLNVSSNKALYDLECE